MTKKERPGGDPPGSAVPGDGLAGDGLVGDGLVGPIVPGDTMADAATAEAIARLTEANLSAGEKRRALGVIANALRLRGLPNALKPKALMGWVGDAVVDIAPRIPLRTLEALRGHHPGLTDQQIADRLVRNAARTSAGIGAIGGGVTAVQWAAPPALLTAPVVLAAETVAVVAVELKLIGELQELYGQPVAGGTVQRSLSLLQAWAGRRGVNLLVPGRSVAAVLSTAARHELRDRLVRRFGRNLTTLGPLLTGAAIAAFLNRRATVKLAEEVRRDLAATRSRALPPG
ncbi:MAG TPA: hypothetical protein VH561_04460 [Micromonosporaceae bacterium]|jgi:hypothetical protein